jgi:hypothetical protein
MGHHLAGPCQQHGLTCLSRRSRESLCHREAAYSDRIRAFGFLSGGDAIIADAHQSPFWIKALGLLHKE